MGITTNLNTFLRSAVQIRHVPLLDNVGSKTPAIKAQVAPMLWVQRFFTPGGSSPAWSWSRKIIKVHSTPEGFGNDLFAVCKLLAA